MAWVWAGIMAGGMAMAAGEVYPTAIFPFADRGEGVKGYGAKVCDILFAQLVADPGLFLVDRAEMEKTLDEAEINLSSLVAPGQATQVGRLTGAKILVTGSVIEADKTLYLVAKIIGTETSKVKGASVKGRTSDGIAGLVEGLASEVAKTIKDNAGQLVSEDADPADRIAAVRKALGAAKRPAVVIRVAERHVGQATIDPAAETELALFCHETGFTVIDREKGTASRADVIIEGTGFSEFAMRRGNLVSVKARLEVKAIDRETDQVLAVDRQVAVEVDLTEQLAGKKALQRAAADIAERLLPKLVRK
jgi:TolB-like protein